MNELKFNAVVFLTFFVLAGGVYWSISTLDRGMAYVRTETPITQDPPVVTTTVTEPEPTTTVITTPTVGEHDDLIDDLQELVDDNIIMQQGSSGTRVGAVQEFINIYEKKSATIDNDYGPGTSRSVRQFQSDFNLVADGQSGPNTYREMIKWLKDQS